MSESKTFYYHFKRFNFWLLFNIFFTYLLICCGIKYPYCFYWTQFHILIILMLITWGLWFYKHLIKQTLTIISDESIKIDHCRPLAWNNIASAEERYVYCGFRKLKVIILNPKPNIQYSYNFLQRHNGPFTPFSLPLYPVITKEEGEELKKIISSKVPYTSLPEENK